MIRKLIFSMSLMAVAIATAHEVPCPFCGLKVVQGTKTQDNEVVLRYGKKKIEYRCVFCAIADSKKYTGDLIIYAPSETKGKPIVIQRAAGKWGTVKDKDGKLVAEEGDVFLNTFTEHDKCAMLSRAFRSKEAFDKYPGSGKAKTLTLDELIAVALK